MTIIKEIEDHKSGLRGSWGASEEAARGPPKDPEGTGRASRGIGKGFRGSWVGLRGSWEGLVLVFSVACWASDQKKLNRNRQRCGLTFLTCRNSSALENLEKT